MLHAHFPCVNILLYDHKQLWEKCSLEAKAHSLTVHYQDEEQKKKERKHFH